MNATVSITVKHKIREKLNIETVPTFNLLNIGTVPTFNLLNVGTVPMFKKLNIGTLKNLFKSISKSEISGRDGVRG